MPSAWGWIKKAMDKVKQFGRNAWHKVIKPVFKAVAPFGKAIGSAVGGAFGGPAGAIAGGKVGGIAGDVMDKWAGGDVRAGIGIIGENVARSRGSVPTWLANG